MCGTVTLGAQYVEFVQNHRRHEILMLHNLQEFKESGLRQARHFMMLQEIRHEVLTEQTQLHQSACRIAMGIVLRKTPEVGECAVVRPQKFEVA